MTDKRFIETMPGAVAAARAASYPIKLLAQPTGMVTKVVEVSKYTRPQRETIDEPESVRESYDSV